MNITTKPKTLVSLFAGGGGSSLGYTQAGYAIKMAVEWDQMAAGVYKRNFPTTPLYVGDIANLTAEEALRITGLSPGELDVLDGSPPCQGFSTAGSREFADSRNRLFEEYVRMLNVFRPKMLVMENVSGLRKGKMKLMFAEMTIALKQAGYRISCRELNAWWYGVPQDRRRLIWVGVREDLSMEPSHPVPNVSRPLSVQEALAPLFTGLDEIQSWSSSDIRFNREPRSGTRVSATLPATSPGKIITKIRNSSYQVEGIEESFGGIKIGWRSVEKPSGTMPAIRPRRLLIKNPDFENKWKSGNGVGPTLKAQQPPSMADGHTVRYLTIEESKILQGFPEWFEIKTNEYKVIGNSVCPPMAEAIGTHIKSLLDAEVIA